MDRRVLSEPSQWRVLASPCQFPVLSRLSAGTKPSEAGKQDHTARLHAIPDCGRDQMSKAARRAAQLLSSRGCLKRQLSEFSDSTRSRWVIRASEPGRSFCTCSKSQTKQISPLRSWPLRRRLVWIMARAGGSHSMLLVRWAERWAIRAWRPVSTWSTILEKSRRLLVTEEV